MRERVAASRTGGGPFSWMDLKSLLSPAARGVCTSAVDLVRAWKRWRLPDPLAPLPPHPDGYGDDLYGDEADRARLAAMQETAREAELFRRGEARAAAAADADAEEAAAPTAKKARDDGTFTLGEHVITRAALERAVAEARAVLPPGGALVWAALWPELLPEGASKPANVKQTRRAWIRWHGLDEEEEEEEEAKPAAAVYAGEEDEEEDEDLHSIGRARVTTFAVNAAVASVTKAVAGRMTCDWAAAAAALAPRCGEAGAQQIKAVWETVNQRLGPPAV